MKNNRIVLFVGSVVLLLTVLLTFAWSQQVVDVPNDDLADHPQTFEEFVEELSKLGPKNKAFFEVLTPYRAVNGKMHTRLLEYQTARPERKDIIQEEYDKLLVEAKQYRNDLVDAAIDAFNETPYQNFIVTSFCTNMLSYESRRDNFDVAFRFADAIIAHPEGLSDQAGSLYLMAAESAFGCMEFDKAEQWYAKAVLLKATLSNDAMGRQRQIPEQKRLWAEELAIRDAEAEADNLPRVLIKTSKGDITIELFEDHAPNSVANFISLVKKGFYRDLPFHRVLPGFMAQGGGECGYCIDCESIPRAGQPVPRKHFRGSVSMARTDMRDTGGSQFFLMFQANANLNGEYTVFGRIIDGMDVLADIQRINPEDEVITDVPDSIIEATVLRDRGHTYEPVKNRIRFGR